MSNLGPGWRLWLGMLGIVITGTLVSIVASVRIADHNTQEQLRLVQTAKTLAAKDQQKAACDLVSRILAAYDETPPPTTAGKNVAEAWREEYRIIQCELVK